MKNKKATNLNHNKQYPVGASRYATQNNQSHVGASALKSAQNAITLVALVVTIIILLILAGVTINLTIGNNGIFNTAQKAAKNYTDAQNKELSNLNEFENTLEKVTQNPEYNPSLLKLKPGDYVKYDTGVKNVGDNGVATFRVLYDATSEYGLQIISDKNIEKITLGGSDWRTAKDSYNNAITTLNKAAEKYLNSTYATDSRCVGSNPKNKNVEITETIVLPRPEWDNKQYIRPDGWISDDTGCYNYTEEDGKIDWNTMNSANIHKTGEWYWMASSGVWAERTVCHFYERRVGDAGDIASTGLCGVYTNGELYSNEYLLGLRPCITLKPNISVTSGDGTSESTSYILGI